jgi:hypothetical protein
MVSSTITEVDILEKVVSPTNGDMNPDAARVILGLKFDSATTRQIRQLMQRNSKGTITAQERLDLEKFLRVGKFIDILQAKARRSLQQIKAAP